MLGTLLIQTLLYHQGDRMREDRSPLIRCLAALTGAVNAQFYQMYNFLRARCEPSGANNRLANASETQ